MLDDMDLALMLDHEQMLEHNLAARILYYPDRFMAARYLALQRFVARFPGGRFLHVETYFIIACHGQDVGAIRL